MAVNFIGVHEINGGLSADTAGYIEKCENIYNQRLAEAAEKIFLDSKERPLVLLSGPSGSGKTTSALRIGKRLRGHGKKVHIISMDNYFLPADAPSIGEIPLDENGKVDLESPMRMDIPLFSEHLEKLFRCEPIAVPKFSFRTQSRVFSEPLCRQKDEIIIIEVIHALNPHVTGDTDDFTNCVYVSVRTRIVLDDDTVLHPRTIRLMRRLCRDKLFRGRSAEDVFAMLPGVTRGEDLYIMPYKDRANFDIDTFLAYEPSVYSTMLLPELEKASETGCFGEDGGALLRTMRRLVPADEDNVPSDSLVREFIGGSSFSY
ncbi:MAG: nucleoside kinase [Oscillospiraceae bacterium]|nr:nucleoside kinase [Oscillospiraceae bacterium]